MPKYISYRPVLIDELITHDRLNSYARVFKHSSDYELVGAYLWNTRVCAALQPLLTGVEVTLRNSIDSSLSKSGYFWWKKGRLGYKSKGVCVPFPVSAIQNDFVSASKQVMKDKKERYKLHHYKPLHQEIIAKTKFSTWEFILDQEFMGPHLIWPKHLGAVLRGRWPSSKASTVLSSTQDLVKTVREFRNRVSHHEPVWKRFQIHNETDAIAHLREKIDRIRQLILLISPEKDELLEQSGLYAYAERICSITELRHCQHATQFHKVKSITKLSRLAQLSLEQNSTQKLTIYKGGRKDLLLVPS